MYVLTFDAETLQNLVALLDAAVKRDGLNAMKAAAPILAQIEQVAAKTQAQEVQSQEAA